MRNDEIAQKLLEFHEAITGLADMAREDRATIKARLDRIDAKLETLGKIEPAVETLKDVAQAYELAGTAGRVLKWMAGLIVAVAAAFAAVKTWVLHHPGGGQ